MSADLQELIRRVEQLSPQELHEFREAIAAMVPETVEQALSRKLRERGLVRAPRATRDPAQAVDPAPVTVQGDSLSETLVRERR